MIVDKRLDDTVPGGMLSWMPTYDVRHMAAWLLDTVFAHIQDESRWGNLAHTRPLQQLEDAPKAVALTAHALADGIRAAAARELVDTLTESGYFKTPELVQTAILAELGKLFLTTVVDGLHATCHDRGMPYQLAIDAMVRRTKDYAAKYDTQAAEASHDATN